jgi:predicted O-linked N-acetylglucosamine transferase (SPINDLY family)
VESDRLVFAPRIPNDEHLARHAMADLFLDTWPYNAHTTASDALWAGLPILTLKGKTFPGRVASSLLSNLNLLELVAIDILSYQEIAIKLASNPSMIEGLKLNIESWKFKYSSPFNSISHTSEMENLFIKIYQNL